MFQHFAQLLDTLSNPRSQQNIPSPDPILFSYIGDKRIEIKNQTAFNKPLDQYRLASWESKEQFEFPVDTILPAHGSVTVWLQSSEVPASLIWTNFRPCGQQERMVLVDPQGGIECEGIIDRSSASVRRTLLFIVSCVSDCAMPDSVEQRVFSLVLD
jgi:hypothetical protein